MRITYPKDTPDDFQPSDERKAALAEAMRKYGRHIYGFFCSQTGNIELAKDLTQDTWLKVYRHFELREFKEEGLLYNKALQVFLDHQRAAKIRRVMGYHADMSQLPVAAMPRAEEGQPSEAFLWDEFWRYFPDTEFDPLDQQCFWLLNRYDYTIKEVAERFGMPPSTVSDKVSRLIKKCREILEKEEP